MRYAPGLPGPEESKRDSSSPSWAARRHIRRWLAIWGAVMVLLVTSVAGFVFLRLHTPPPQIGFRPLPYLFIWQHPAPGNLTPRQAYDQEGRIASAHSLAAPAATLWVAQTDDAALALTLLARGPLDREHLAVVMLERTGGASGTWSADAQPPPGGSGCGAAGGYCLQIAERALVHQIEGFGSVNSASASDIFARFAEPLAGPVQGGMLDGTRFYADSGKPADDANASLVIVGTSDQSDIDAAADWLTTQP